MIKEPINNRPDILEKFNAAAFGITQNYGIELYKEHVGPNEFSMYCEVDTPETGETRLFAVYDTRNGPVFEEIP